ncbi:unnamed protein product [Paramecium primaurelia]|uniref:FCP1 homology domain-containing protein n=1 Tax=Paramecium primaurelia TaxID=5886 RepID=A0A8S1LJ41_PARPR|nr:unnamed protein product [Paramecium primaurelia]
MNLSRNGSNKFSRHDRIAYSQILDLKKNKIYSSSTKNSDQSNGYFLSLANMKAPDYGQAQLLNNDALKNKINEKRNQKSMDNELNKFVTRVETKLISSPLKKKVIAIDTKIDMPTQIKPYSLTPQSRLQSFRIASPSQKPRSSSQNKRNEIYYLSKLQRAFDTNGSDYFSRMYRQHFHQTYQGLNCRLFPQNNNDYNKSHKLPKKHQRQYTLFFDLDETLVHCNETPSIPCDVVLEINVSKHQIVRAGINVRPYAKEMLKNLSNYFEIIIFTASHSSYAEKVCNYLDPDSNIISHRLFRDSCTQTNTSLYTKDLRLFCENTNRQLSQVALIDNASYSYAWQIENGIPILPFYDNKDDRELIDLEKYLKNMIGVSDIREYNRNNLKLHLFVDQRGPYKVLENLFGKPQQLL